MSLSRRQLLSGLAGVTGALLLPPTLAENAEAAGRRYWALDSAMLGYGPWQSATLGYGKFGGDDNTIARISHRTTPQGWEDRLDWVNPDYQDRLLIKPGQSGGFLIEFVTLAPDWVDVHGW